MITLRGCAVLLRIGGTYFLAMIPVIVVAAVAVVEEEAQLVAPAEVQLAALEEEVAIPIKETILTIVDQ